MLLSFKQADLREEKCGSTEIHTKKLKVLLHLLAHEVLSKQANSKSLQCSVVHRRSEL